MCCDNKCMFFIKPRMGSLIFGYITAVLSGIGILVCVGLTFYFLTTMMIYLGNNNQGVLQAMVYVTVLFIEFTAGFTCTVLMLYGITENKPVLVKTYIIYSMIHLVLLLIVVIILFFTCLFIFGLLFLLGCVVYMSFVYLVFLAYKDMISNKEGHVFSNPPNLLMA